MRDAVVAMSAGLALLGGIACGRSVLVEQGSGDASAVGGAGGLGSGDGGAGSGTSGSGVTGSGTSSSAGTGAGGAPSGASGSGGSEPTCPSLGDPCTGCASSQCAGHWCGCSNNPECLALFACTGQCTDETCQQGCLTQHADGIADALLVNGCAGTTCSAQCGFGNPDFGDCQACIFDDCAAETNACLSQPTCSALWSCLLDCEPLELTCQQSCYDAFGSGAATLQTLFGCAANLCDDVCN